MPRKVDQQVENVVVRSPAPNKKPHESGHEKIARLRACMEAAERDGILLDGDTLIELAALMTKGLEQLRRGV